MQISRRTALAGGAAAITTAAVTVPLAIKAAGVKVALASASDARIFALVEEHERAGVEADKAGERWFEAVMGRMPPRLRHVSPFDTPEGLPSQVVWDAILEASNYPEVEALKAAEDRFKERCRELVDRLSRTEATTLQGVCIKFRIAMRPRHRIGYDLIDSAATDIERMAGEARS